MINSTSNTDLRPKCPECGEPRPLVTWTGPNPPKCAKCAGATVVDVPIDDNVDFEDSPDMDLDSMLDASKSDIQRLERKLDRIIKLLEDN